MDYKTNIYLKNWENYWQDYLFLNPDLKEAGITCKKKSKNHYIKCGIKEGRKVEYKEEYNNDHDVQILQVQSQSQPERQEPIKEQNLEKQSPFVLKKSMFREKI